jgi:hypothetical protein
MTTIKATCPACGDVELTPYQLTVTVIPALHRSHYAFLCPQCLDLVEKPADDEVVTLLAAAGVCVRRLTVPAEVLEDHAGPAVTYDDVLDFALWLEACDDLAGAALTG